MPIRADPQSAWARRAVFGRSARPNTGKRFGMGRKGLRRISPRDARRQTVRTLRHLRDHAIHMAQDSLAAGEWRVALLCLWKAARYDDQAAALGGAEPTSTPAG
jgi:hypothetical protein